MKVFLVVIFGLITGIGAAQQPFADSVTKPLQRNKLLFEKTFIHTNKTAYFIDDVIWFKAYVGDTDNKPSLKTTRLSVNLLDAKGKIVQEKSIFIHKGVGMGQFLLSDSLKSGVYYIQSYTNFMRNFGSSNMAIQKVKILNKVASKETILKSKYDIQLFPEGGYLLENTENVIGIKVVLNNKGSDYLGKIVNSKNQEIANFASTHLGMTKCKFLYNSDEKYTAVFTIKDSIIKVAFPIAKKEGVLLTIDNTKRDHLNLNVKTNSISLVNLKKSKYTLLFHQRNKVIDFYNIPGMEGYNINLEFDKNIFYNGVNTVTLFKDNQPISERKFYIENESEEVSISVKSENSTNDSIAYNLKVIESKSNTPIKANLSIAVLPFDTVHFNEFANIKSSFLLSPYVKGFLENPAYYFDKNNLEREKYLDLVLLTQGWTQYSLDEMISALNPSYKYDFEQGYKLNGTVSPLFTNELALMTSENRIIDKLFLKGKKDFSFSKLLIYKGDAVKVSFINQLNEAIKPENLSFNPFIKNPIISVNNDSFVHNERLEKSNEDLWEESYFSNSIKLNEIVINTRNRGSLYYQKQKLVKQYKPLVFDIGKYYPIEIPERYKKENDDIMSFLNFDQNIRLVVLKDLESYLEFGVGKKAVLYIDGEQVKNSALLSVNLRINEVENIMIQPSGNDKTIQIFTTENYKKNEETLFKDYIFKEGFDREKKYYSPMYDFDSNTHSNWVEIDWKSVVLTNELGLADINIKQNKEIAAYLLSIQGFSDDGVLISAVLKVNN